MTGTVQFEKINGGVPYKTAFYTKDEQGMLPDAAVNMAAGTLVHAPMYTTEVGPTGIITVRSYEVYVDETVDASTGDDGAANVTKVVTRLAKVASDNITDYTDYDCVVTPTYDTEGVAWTIDATTKVLAGGTLTVVNKNTNEATADFRVVYVCEVTA